MKHPEIIPFVVVIGIVIISAICLVNSADRIKSVEKAERTADYIIAPKVHTCTEAQMTKVQSETLFCKNETGYFSSYCYGTAIMRNCTKNPTTEN